MKNMMLFHAVPQMLYALHTTPGCKRVTKYISKKLTLKATFQRPVDKRDKASTVLITIGKPNFAERKFIDLCQKAGERFPVRKLQLHVPRSRA